MHTTPPIYLDNAATTTIDSVVLEAMEPYLKDYYGNPSSPYHLATFSKVAIENARRIITRILHAQDGHIFFTSSGTEANNMAIKGLIEAYDIKHVITSPLEHMSVLQPIAYLQQKKIITTHFLPIDSTGSINYTILEQLLETYPNSLVSLMHGNNEIGNITDIEQVAILCKKYKAFFHSDMVQTIGYTSINLSAIPIDLATASAHKFHGPKGVGFIYIRNGVKLTPLLHGGSQERTMRPGTENVPAIVGMAKALQIASSQRKEIYNHLLALKEHMITGLQKTIPNIIFHGKCSEKRSLPNILNVGFPWEKHHETILLHLDLQGIQASAGSACMSGTNLHSHVLIALNIPTTRPVVRFSFSKKNTLQEIKEVIKKIATL